MVRTLDTDRNASGRTSGTAGKNARRTTAQRTRVRQTAARRTTTSQKTTARQITAQTTTARTTRTQGTRTRTAAVQGTTAQTTRAPKTTVQTRTARTARTQKTAVQTRAEQNTRATTQIKSGKGIRTAEKSVQKRQSDRAVKRAVKADIEPAGRGVRVDVDSYNAAGGEMRVPRSAMSFQTVIVMLALIAVMTVILVFYITLQSEVTETSQLIADKEQELTQLKAENDASYNDINDSISLEEVRRRAIQDLGMKYADRDQVVIYTGTEKDSVHQVSSLNGN